MKNKLKILLLLCSCFFLSGCTVEYNLNIKNAKFKESIVIQGTGHENEQFYSTLKKWNIPAFYDDIIYNSDNPDKVKGVKYYKRNVNDRNFMVKLNYEFKQDNYADSTMANFCYNNFFAYENEETKTISYTASMDFKCFTTYEELDNVVVKLKTSRKMVNHNADSVDGKTYIWNITRDNALGKYIFFELDNKGLTFFTILKYILIVFSILAILALLVIIYFRYKWLKANRI